jgi:subtilisin family serine protease
VTYATPDLALAALPAWEAAGAAPEPVVRRTLARRAVGPDPRRADQWHLDQINAAGAWTSTRGNGVVVAVVDDGLEYDHPDLTDRCPAIATGLHANFNGGPANDPSPVGATDGHGTACAGLAASTAGNALGGAGVAPEARLFGLRLIAATPTEADIATALGWRWTAATDAVHVSTNSWGPPDAEPEASYVGPGGLTQASIAQAVASGRSGLGGIILFAAGNGGLANDNSNYDGFANMREVIAVGGVLRDGTPAPYADAGANILLAGPTGTGPEIPGQGLVTTDLTGADGYVPGDTFDYFNGTSGSCPVVAGAVALTLARQPNLGWRDVKEILLRSAEPTDLGAGLWQTNQAGLRFHPKLGAGRVDAEEAVGLAATWTPLAPETSIIVSATGLPAGIADVGAAAVATCVVTEPLRVEHAQVRMRLTHSYHGDLKIVLTSPSGMTSELATPHNWPLPNGQEFPDYPADGWTYMSVRHWGELSAGTWTVSVEDEQAGDAGQLTAVELILWGVELSGYTPGSPTGITQVRLLSHGLEVASTTSAPFNLPYDSLPPGRHHLVAEILRNGVLQFDRVVVDRPGTRPAITSAPPLAAREGVVLSSTCTASGGSVTWSLPEAPAGMAITSGGQLTWTPPTSVADPGTARHIRVVVRATLAAGGGIDDQTFHIAVADAALPAPG